MKRMLILVLFLVAVLFPTSAFAVDFEISEVTIDAYLQPNGEANVIEKHTYVFDSKFKGIIREVDLDEWKRLSKDDKFRAYTYATGCGDKSFGKRFTEFAEDSYQ